MPEAPEESNNGDGTPLMVLGRRRAGQSWHAPWFVNEAGSQLLQVKELCLENWVLCPQLPPEPSGLYQRQLPSQGRWPRPLSTPGALSRVLGTWSWPHLRTYRVTQRPHLPAHPDRSAGAADSPRNIRTGNSKPQSCI